VAVIKEALRRPADRRRRWWRSLRSPLRSRGYDAYSRDRGPASLVKGCTVTSAPTPTDAPTGRHLPNALVEGRRRDPHRRVSSRAATDNRSPMSSAGRSRGGCRRRCCRCRRRDGRHLGSRRRRHLGSRRRRRLHGFRLWRSFAVAASVEERRPAVAGQRLARQQLRRRQHRGDDHECEHARDHGDLQPPTSSAGRRVGRRVAPVRARARPRVGL
jgi:hypothetical protein